MNTPDQLRDRAWFFWRACLSAIQAAADTSGMTPADLADATGYHVTRLRRVLRGQERLTMELFFCLCETLGLAPDDITAAAEAEADTVTA